MLYSPKEVSRISTLTKNQFDTLRQHGIHISSEGAAPHIYYSRHGFFEILLVRELRARQFDFDQVKRILHELRWREPMGRLPWEAGLRWMLTDGYTVHFVAEPDVVLAFLE